MDDFSLFYDDVERKSEVRFEVFGEVGVGGEVVPVEEVSELSGERATWSSKASSVGDKGCCDSIFNCAYY